VPCVYCCPSGVAAIASSRFWPARIACRTDSSTHSIGQVTAQDRPEVSSPCPGTMVPTSSVCVTFAFWCARGAGAPHLGSGTARRTIFRREARVGRTGTDRPTPEKSRIPKRANTSVEVGTIVPGNGLLTSGAILGRYLPYLSELIESVRQLSGLARTWRKRSRHSARAAIHAGTAGSDSLVAQFVAFWPAITIAGTCGGSKG